MTEQVATPAPTRAGAWIARSLVGLADRIAARPRTALATLAAAQVAATVVLGLTATHNGWAWFQGGDQIWYTTDGWLLGRLHLPPGEVSYGWPLVVAPVEWLTGPTWIQAMPWIAALNVLVLGPIALLCVYGITARLVGRLLGLVAATLWVVAPYVAIPLWVDRYHERWVDQFVPQAVGLSALADFPSMVALLVAAWLLLRAIDLRSWSDATAAGLLAGYAGAMKPPNLLFLAGAGLALLAARRWREGAIFAVALAPALLTLLVWKERGLGSIPLFALDEVRHAAGTQVAGLSVDRYVDIDWNHWKLQMSELREFFRAARLVQWAPLAGAVALALVRRWAGLGLLAGWLGAFLLVKGTSPLADIEAGSFFRLLMPAWPAYLLLLAPLPLLVPTFPRRFGARLEPPPARPLRPRWVWAAIVALGLVPLLVVAAARPLDGPDRAVVQQLELTTVLTPVDTSIAVQTRRDGESQVLTWEDDGWHADVTYVVLRTPGAGPDVSCATAGVTRCTLTMIRLGETREREFTDGSPPPGVTYRIGVATDYRDRPGGDMFAVSAPVRAAP
jgi:hypothetical protein